MSIIVPAGKYGINWVPSEKKLTKIAQSDMGGAVEDVDVEDDSRDALYEAAKGVVDAMDAEQGAVVETDVSVGDGEIVEEVGEKIEEEVEGAGDSVEEAVEKVEEAVEDLKVAVEGGDVTEIGDEEEVEIPVEEDNGELIVESIPCEVDDCGSMDGTAEEVVETEVETEVEAGMDKSASSNEFCKFGKLSPQNRKKVADYWKNALGYPADYVSLMVKDYEK